MSNSMQFYETLFGDRIILFSSSIKEKDAESEAAITTEISHAEKKILKPFSDIESDLMSKWSNRFNGLSKDTCKHVHTHTHICIHKHTDTNTN